MTELKHITASTWELDRAGLFTGMLFAETALEHSCHHLHRESWSIEDSRKVLGTAFKDFPASFRVIASDPSELLCLAGKEMVIHLSWRGQELSVWYAGRSYEAWKEFSRSLREVFPEVEIEGAGKVSMQFWVQEHGGRSIGRAIEVHNWAEIEENYPGRTSPQLDRLMQNFVSGKGGQLLLFHGAPGVGKTFAIRALCWEWRNNCTFHYITDPEQFFGSASYMFRVLMDESDAEGAPWSEPEDEKWKLLIVEDAGELLSRDAKERVGQGLSRLLNVVDGMIGQGMKVLVLITTNEKLRAIHPAIARRGRCAAEIEFEQFNLQAAREWLDNHGVEDSELPKNLSLASLFAAKEGVLEEESSAVKVGF